MEHAVKAARVRLVPTVQRQGLPEIQKSIQNKQKLFALPELRFYSFQ